MDRTDDILIPEGTRWLRDADAQAVCRAVAAGGHQILFVGGCVRNALLRQADSDVDLATDARPETVMALANEAGLKAVPTGIDHGTVTLVSGGKGFEVTTFRRDVETDGRRAVVAFSDDIAEDARRRDFTMNALYARPDGKVLDPLGGLPDLRAGRVRFIEDAQQRIQEDFLRILRFFRFHAWYAHTDAGFDAEALDAIARNTSGLETISAERIGTELRKLLSAPDPATAVAQMRQTGVLSAILPGSDDRFLGPVVHLEALLGQAPHWLLRLAALGGLDVAERLRLSRSDARELAAIAEASYGAAPLPEVAYREGRAIGIAALVLRAALAGQPPDKAMVHQIEQAVAAHFPVVAADLMPGFSGPALGRRLKKLEKAWIASGFALDRDALMALPDT